MAGSVAEASVVIEQTRPELAVVEIADGDREPYAWLSEQRQRWPETKIIVFSGRDDPDAIASALAYGAAAYVVK